MPPIALRDLAAEIVRRAVDGRPDKTLPYVVGLSEPPTPKEQLLLAACRLMRQPMAIMPTKCDTVEEWVKRYGAKRQSQLARLPKTPAQHLSYNVMA